MNEYTKEDINESSIVVGCNYHTTWQSHKNMRFVLGKVKNNWAYLKTRRTKRHFKTPVSTLKFIMTNHNICKALKILNGKTKQT